MPLDTTSSELLERHRGFWSRSPGSLLLNRVPQRIYQPRPFPRFGAGEVTEPTEFAAPDLDLDRYVGVTPTASSDLIAFVGDLVRCVGPVFPEAWMSSARR